MSLRDKILTANDLDEEIMDVPEWDAKVLLIGMTGKQRIVLVDKASGGDKGYMYADILLAIARDPDTRELIFDPADREALADKSGGVQERLALKVLQLSGVSTGDDDETEVADDPTSVGS